MPYGIYEERKCTQKGHSKFVPTKHQEDTVNAFIHKKYKGMLLYHKLGCLAPDTPVLLWDGNVKRADSIKNGDILIGDDGTPREVLETVHGTDDMYRITQKNGDDYTVNGEHILSLKFSGNMAVTWIEKTKTWMMVWFDKKALKMRYKTKMCKNITKEQGYKYICNFRNSIYEDNIVDIRVKDYISLPNHAKAQLRGYRCEKVVWKHRDVCLDPYILGAWLGDGNSRGDGFTTTDIQIYDAFLSWADQNDSVIRKVKGDKYGYYIRNITHGLSPFKNCLRNYNLIGNKHIPRDYLINDEETRLQVLAGIIDTDGHVCKNYVEITQKNKVLAEHICYLARSLGFYCSYNERQKYCMYKGEKRTGTYYTMRISGNGQEKIPTLIPRKKLLPRKQVKNPLVTGLEVHPIGVGEYYGWKLDGNKRFLLGDFTVTHNSGKTCTSLLIADKLLRRKKIKKVFVLTPGSLRSGWVTEYCRVCGYKPKYLEKYYTFITYNFNVGNKLPDFDDSLVIIDEVHNLINGAKNMSYNPTQIYNKIDKADCSILALSGTPVFNYVYEFALLGRLLKPGKYFPDIRPTTIVKKSGGSKVNEHAFMKYFHIESDGTLKPRNPTSMKRRLDGIISYYPGAGKEFVPEVIYEKPIEVEMSTEQEKNYWAKKEQEAILGIPPSMALIHKDPQRYELLKRLYIMAKKNILTRSASNFYYGSWNLAKEFRGADPNDLPENATCLKDVIKGNGGWVRKKYFRDGALYKLYSPKFTALLLNIVMHNEQKHFVFTFFKEKSGVVLLKTLLNMCGITAEIFSGDLDDKSRRSLLKRYNAPENRYGQKIRVLLVTEAGCQGISLLETRHMHILESSPRVSITTQAIGRIARYKSHINLPKDEQNVRIWRYWSMASEIPITINTTVFAPDGSEETVTKIITDKKAIDTILYEKGQKTIREIDTFLDLLKSVSVTPY